MKLCGGGEQKRGSQAQPAWPESKSSFGQLPRGGPSFLSLCARRRKGKGTARVRAWQGVGIRESALSDEGLKECSREMRVERLNRSRVGVYARAPACPISISVSLTMYV